MSVFRSGILRFAWLGNLVVALGTKRAGTGLVLLQPEQKHVENVQKMEAFQFDAKPFVPEEVLSQDKMAKAYYKPETVRKVKMPVLPLTKRNVPSIGGAAASKRRLTTQAIATAATKRKVQQESLRRGETMPHIQARGRKKATQYDFDPASSIMQAVGTRRHIGGQQQTVSKGYVSPTARHIGPSRLDQTKRQMKMVQSMRAATGRKVTGPPAPPPPPPSFARKSTRLMQKSVAVKPTVLQQTQSPRRILGTSTRRVIAPAKKILPPVMTSRKPEISKYAAKMPTRREVLRIAEETEDESTFEEILPVKTRRGAAKRHAQTLRPQRGKKKTVKAPTLSFSDIPSSSDLTEAEDSSSSSEPLAQTRRYGKKPVDFNKKKKLRPKKPAVTQRKVVKETATKRKQTNQKKKKKTVAVIESDSDESTSSSSFERQFTRRQVLKTKPKKPAVKETKRKARKVVQSLSSSTEEEFTSSQASSETSESSSSSEYDQTRLKGKPIQTRRKVQTGRKAKKPGTKPVKPVKDKHGKGKKQIREETVSASQESLVIQPGRKQAAKARRALAPKWKKEGPTNRKVAPTKRKATAVTKRDTKIKRKAKPRGKYISSETETSAPQSSTMEPSSSSYRPTRRQAAVQTKKKLGYGTPTPTKRRH